MCLQLTRLPVNGYGVAAFAVVSFIIAKLFRRPNVSTPTLEMLALQLNHYYYYYYYSLMHSRL